ncbi:hypothetical protein HK099_001489 [Clydaea vesicula]|uniref:F-box domain-containing protein n=1 Tax=Clydaea vesicula TaxID=447962 RepID=A0AAD5U3P7_9FUNG|nr:hypothetical protein HK099_001489 [Clydaea vesicula]KAJ3397424.1 hypothetical protein HDU92_007813 [Lobulomyces angularis]
MLTFTQFPVEILLEIFFQLDCNDLNAFSLTCIKFLKISRDPHSVANLIIKKFSNSTKLSVCKSVLYLLNRNTASKSLQVVVPTNPRITYSRPFHEEYPQQPFRNRRIYAGRNTELLGASVPIVANELNNGIKSFAKAFTVKVCVVLLRRGAIIPRFLFQLIIKDVSLIPPDLFSFLVGLGLQLYGCNVEFHSDDHASVTKIVMDAVLAHWVRDANNANNYTAIIGNPVAKASPELALLRKIIKEYKYMPLNVGGRNNNNISYLLFKLANMEMQLIDEMKSNGFDLSTVNDDVLKWVLRRQTGSPLESLQTFLRHGFELTPDVIIHGLQLGRSDILEALRALICQKDLQNHAEEIVLDLLGPKKVYTTDGILDYIRSSFNISDNLVGEALLGVSKDSAYQTRPFPQEHPATAWKWTLRHYGPSHPFTLASFDDILMKLAAGPASHCCLRSLPDQFLSAGLKFQPKHLKYFVQMAVSSEMDSLLDHLFDLLRLQLTATHYSERKKWNQSLLEADVDQGILNKILGKMDTALSNRRSKRLKKSHDY